MKALVKMLNFEGLVVASSIIDVGSVDEQGLKVAEKILNDNFAKMGFKGYCKVEPIDTKDGGIGGR